MSIRETVFKKAEHYRIIDNEKDAGELDAIAAFAERVCEDMIDGMLDMFTDGLIIGRREKKKPKEEEEYERS